MMRPSGFEVFLSILSILYILSRGGGGSLLYPPPPKKFKFCAKSQKVKVFPLSMQEVQEFVANQSNTSSSNTMINESGKGV